MDTCIRVPAEPWILGLAGILLLLALLPLTRHHVARAFAICASALVLLGPLAAYISADPAQSCSHANAAHLEKP